MRFRLTRRGDRLLVEFVSSKEQFVLGELQFEDGDGDVRRDVRELLTVSVIDNPFFETVGKD